ncbi:PAN2-PAN3 deadenylation complex subunit PAN3 [Ischnura elegans]|uniref:PAN2-PAN3 deadenylation complex subunit PAN3 n=1 Tax=Ischnura elegans TaxID=197161 RepID=UPI001ED89190|nr:PAN2-PAN3 deadenylation complex subunit PAN3 [Ischnura elegans]XP_046391294.1 PAN2-PAN3 deadenylation complex subunit PAN3 [Ischnura elegans]XP_046391295.1 PAN2-PAN3 deadenylation complex subunit PAN3 [Ischnura elegans]XP_046391296.1 PAN2-PAN3 deadenylation complex subunit PAN3 [Ischnura elegans]
MDPLFLAFSQQTNGVPQESKLATYMSHQSAINNHPSTVSSNALAKGISGLSLEKKVPSSGLPLGGHSPPSPTPPFYPPANFLGSFPGLAASPSTSARRRVAGPPAVSPLPSSPLHTLGGFESGTSPTGMPSSSMQLHNQSTSPTSSPGRIRCSPSPNMPAALDEKATIEMAVPVPTYQENVGGTTYFYPAGGDSAAIHPHLNMHHPMQVAPHCPAGPVPPVTTGPSLVFSAYRVYPGPPSHLGTAPLTATSPRSSPPLAVPTSSPRPTSPTSSSQPAISSGPSPSGPTLRPLPAPPPMSSWFLVAEELRADTLRKHALTLAQPDPEQFPDLPTEVDNYHDLCPLEALNANNGLSGLAVGQPPGHVGHHGLHPRHSMHHSLQSHQRLAHHVHHHHKSSSSLGYLTSTYKATHSKTGVRYCLKRIHGFRLSNTKCMLLVDMWKRLQHPNVVQLREIFSTKAFGDHSLVFVFDFHAGAETLLDKHFSQAEAMNGYIDAFSSDPSAPRPYSHHKNTLLRQHSNLLPESLIWNYIIQITSAVRVVHGAGLALRGSLEPHRVLVCGKTRLRLSGCGIPDVLASFDPSSSAPSPPPPPPPPSSVTGGASSPAVGATSSPSQSGQSSSSNSAPSAFLAMVSHYQQEDLRALGRLVLSLACRSLAAPHRDHLQASLDLVSRSYSPDLRNLILYLLSGPPQQQSAQLGSSSSGGLGSSGSPVNVGNSRAHSVADLMPMIGARFYTQLDVLALRADTLEEEVAKEMENGRLCRLLVKLGAINERPELNLDGSWSETGDRYMLKLFRDYLFHQVEEDGRPWLDMAHVTHCLNKLDCGAPDRICLMSRDEQSVLVVTYAELKQCLENSFAEITTSASVPSHHSHSLTASSHSATS